MAQTIEGASECVEAVSFSFMTDAEVRRHSVTKITNPNLVDGVGRPLPGGLYDPSLGPIDEQTSCKSCGQRVFHCSGHCGHIDLISPVYNPLLFNMLYIVLQRTCFHCHHFRASRVEVERCASQLELIGKGDVIGAKRLGIISPSEDDIGGSFMDQSGSQDYKSDNQMQSAWTSLQFTEAKTVLNKFLRPKFLKCENCTLKNCKISKPTFGWIHMNAMPDADTRSNIIRGGKFEGPISDRSDDRPTSEVVDASECTSRGDLDNAEINSITVASNASEISAFNEHVSEGGEGRLQSFKHLKNSSRPLLPSEVRDTIKLLWENEPHLCSFICNVQRESLNIAGDAAGYSMFFLEALLVPPTKFRPAARGGNSVMEHPHTVLLGKVLQSNIALANAHVNRTDRSKIINRWRDLQQSVNMLYDSKTAVGQGQRDANSGICQMLEKKEGIFRQKMMGKRVNYACRSVISPDPYLAVNEIGIPPYFALRLTYPERVTPWNVANLRNAIINGPDILPGAITYSDKVTTMKLQPNKKARISISRKLPSSRGVVTQSDKGSEYGFEGKTVYRHLRDGDIVLVNRQPTLHKPSIMAHVVRVLKGEKTLRMHYANCSTYNADFDGDEMNVHLPQDEVSRAEAYNIVNANNQYIVPTRGDTVRGLIQDHIVGAVLLTMKDTFLTHGEFNQLLYGCGVFTSRASFSGSCSQKVSLLDAEGVMLPVLPAVWKPEPLWTGKQVITALLNHLTRGCKPCTVEKEGKIPDQYFTGDTRKRQSREANAENKLLIRKNDLVHGVIDKAQFGKYGLVHTVQELYGSNSAGILLSAFSRLFTLFLQFNGFTCGVDDLIIVPRCDIQRKKELEDEDVGEEVHCDFVQFKRGQIGPVELQMEVEKVIRRNGQSAIAGLDMKMKNKLTEKGSKVSKELLLKGLLKPFPRNCISLMTITGAKGSTVNFQQISSYLGQQELEGKRVPRMVSGKTLPCFPPWDFASRAGGFITDRFLTGLRPQEYYFHCMAGREGLVDTAVKTSRSGYLQRCLIKNLESLKVCYDYTVRDADGSIIQFYYGEDGVDVHQTSFLNKFEALAANQEIIRQKSPHHLVYNHYIKELPEGLKRKAEDFVKNLPQKDQKKFWKLMKQKYLSSLAQPGEPVGVIAGQSVGEPSTQMTLNTFHLAGRGEMNVTLGIPRLQEILMTASSDIKTPIITCPLLEQRSKNDAKALVGNVRKVTVADIIESVEVHLMPISFHNNEVCRVYKLVVKLKAHELVSLEDCEETLENLFLDELLDAIESHIKLLSKISGIKNLLQNTRSKASDETGDDVPGSGLKTVNNEDDDDDGGGDSEGDDERAEDLGSDAWKRRMQASDEMNYEESSADEFDEVETSAELKQETIQAEDAVNIREGSENEDLDEGTEMQAEHGVTSTPDKGERKVNSKIKRKKKESKLEKSDRAIYVAAKGLHFEAHFRFVNEPHILLAQIAQKTAKKVDIKSSGKIDQCTMVEYDVNEKQVLWNKELLTSAPSNKMGTSLKKDQGNVEHEDSSTYWALKAAGANFNAFWEMQDDLDVKRVYSNNIHLMLNTFGVEAARTTIISEIKQVFGIYGVEIDYRHLSLIADYMTHSGGYRPMSRHGSIAESISPFLKMSFETASKFIVEAASHGMTDNLETPSARICLGLPVKVGTGCFNLMQKLDYDVQ